MTEPTPNTTRRQFLETTGAVATASANCKSEFAPDVDKLTMTSPAPLVMDKLTKRYPVPQPGIVRDREDLA